MSLDYSKCMTCGKPLDYEPRMCCNGQDCACMGRPIEPPVCSIECHDKAFPDTTQGTPTIGVPVVIEQTDYGIAVRDSGLLDEKPNGVALTYSDIRTRLTEAAIWGRDNPGFTPEMLMAFLKEIGA